MRRSLINGGGIESVLYEQLGALAFRLVRVNLKAREKGVFRDLVKAGTLQVFLNQSGEGFLLTPQCRVSMFSRTLAIVETGEMVKEEDITLTRFSSTLPQEFLLLTLPLATAQGLFGKR